MPIIVISKRLRVALIFTVKKTVYGVNIFKSLKRLPCKNYTITVGVELLGGSFTAIIRNRKFLNRGDYQ